jgi:hypothetical protein
MSISLGNAFFKLPMLDGVLSAGAGESVPLARAIGGVAVPGELVPLA